MKVVLKSAPDEGSVTVMVHGNTYEELDEAQLALNTEWVDLSSYDFPMVWHTHSGNIRRFELLVRFSNKAEAMRFKLSHHEVED